MPAGGGILLDGKEGAIGRGLRWWGRTLLAMVPEPVRHWLRPQGLVLGYDGKDLLFEGAPLDGVHASALSSRKADMVLQLDQQQGIVFHEQLSVAADGQVDTGSLRDEVARHTPFALERVHVGMKPQGAVGPDGRQAFVVGVIRKELLIEVQEKLSAFGLDSVRIVIAQPDGGALSLSGAVSAGGNDKRPLIPALLILSFLFLLTVPFIDTYLRHEEALAICAEQQARLADLTGGPADQNRQVRPLILEAIRGRETQPVAVEVLEKLSALLPLDSSLVFLKLEGRHLSIEGVTRNSGGMLSALQQADWIEQVAFVAPLVREENGGERFQLKVTMRSVGEGSR